ncbi:Meiotic Sister-Chromatid recombination aldehyde dehydrogenase [Elasticomyces elasticus]|nr:Meiotic Sister-Chromatid recombination aldehyde dehydrogenase [Elasticomyces elasticus]
MTAIPALPPWALGAIFAIVAYYLAYLYLRNDPETPVPFTSSIPEQCRPGWRGEILETLSIKVTGSTAIQCYAPATGESLGLVNPTTADGIDRAVAKAAKAQIEWARTSWPQRRRVLKTLLKHVLDNQDLICTIACLDSGKTRIDALFGEILVTAEKLRWSIDHGEKALRPESRPTNLLMCYKKNEVRWEPLGVVAACVSWNYPFHNLFGPLISALFSGNAILLKSSEQTAWSSTHFASIARNALVACGHPPDLIQNVPCWPAAADHLTSHPGISHITFIGSRPVAHYVCASAAKALTPVTVELGGKDAAIVLDDCGPDIDRIASVLMRGVFQSAGQNCIGIERIVAMPKAFAALEKRLTDRIAQLRVGNGLGPNTVDMGAMVSDVSFARLELLVQDAVSQGAKLVHGGKRLPHPVYLHGHYFAPTLLTHVTSSMRIAQEEVFGPTCVLMAASSISEAVEIANSTSYGLGCSVFGPTTSTTARANLEHVTREVKAGMVAVNDFAAYYAVQLPFGGSKGSGYGRFAGEEGLRSLCNQKAVCVDRLPSLVKTKIPPPLDYPVDSRGPEMAKGVVELGYADGIVGKMQGLRKILNW